MAVRTFTPTRNAPALPGIALLGLKTKDVFELGKAVEKGFAIATIDRFGKHLQLTLSETLRLLGLSESTYHHYRRNKRNLGMDTSANLYRLAWVTDVAEQYFENTSAAHAWLLLSRETFGNKSPFQFALLPGGSEYVITVLNRLEHGVYV